MITNRLSQDWLYKPFYELVLSPPCEVKGMEIPTFYMSFYRRGR
nr:MAG TPA: hypothetical protein [Caudoviricetes sp.]